MLDAEAGEFVSDVADRENVQLGLGGGEGEGVGLGERERVAVCVGAADGLQVVVGEEDGGDNVTERLGASVVLRLGGVGVNDRVLVTVGERVAKEMEVRVPGEAVGE